MPTDDEDRELDSLTAALADAPDSIEPGPDQKAMDEFLARRARDFDVVRDAVADIPEPGTALEFASDYEAVRADRLATLGKSVVDNPLSQPLRPGR